MKILAVGDVFGKVGRRVLKAGLNNVVAMTHADFVIVNGENLAGGFGVTKDLLDYVLSCGADVVTTGNHVWDKKETQSLLKSEPRLLRPANYPKTTPGVGARVYRTNKGVEVGVLNVQGRVFMDAIDCPFRRAEEELERIAERTNIIIVEIHGEATSEKKALGYFLDGRVSAVLGSHTHVQTADEQILPRGSAYITDLGMTGATHSVIGVRVEIILKRFIHKLPEKFVEASGPGQFCAVIIEIDDKTGKAVSINRTQVNYD